MLTGCSSDEDTQEVTESTSSVSEDTNSSGILQFFKDDDEEISPALEFYDLTEMSSTMIFSQVYDLIINPINYEGSTFKIQGEYEFYTIPETTDTVYFIVIMDAAGCCPQGLEVRFPGDVAPPDEFCEVIIEGTSLSEVDGIYTYVHIDVSSLEVV